MRCHHEDLGQENHTGKLAQAKRHVGQRLAETRPRQLSCGPWVQTPEGGFKDHLKRYGGTADSKAALSCPQASSHLPELDDVRVHKRPVVYQLPLHVLVDLRRCDWSLRGES